METVQRGAERYQAAAIACMRAIFQASPGCDQHLPNCASLGPGCWGWPACEGSRCSHTGGCVATHSLCSTAGRMPPHPPTPTPTPTRCVHHAHYGLPAPHACKRRSPPSTWAPRAGPPPTRASRSSCRRTSAARSVGRCWRRSSPCCASRVRVSPAAMSGHAMLSGSAGVCLQVLRISMWVVPHSAAFLA